jgi:hypothetical protein
MESFSLLPNKGNQVPARYPTNSMRDLIKEERVIITSVPKTISITPGWAISIPKGLWPRLILQGDMVY